MKMVVLMLHAQLVFF